MQNWHVQQGRVGSRIERCNEGTLARKGEGERCNIARQIREVKGADWESKQERIGR